MHQPDIVSSAFHADPGATHDRMRSASVTRLRQPVIGAIELGTTHDACSALLKDHENFARDPANAGKFFASSHPEGLARDPSLSTGPRR
jgi:hypothetical protein